VTDTPQPSQANKRPLLSSLAMHHVHQFAKSENRSLSSANSELVNRGFDSWLEQTTARVMPKAPGVNPASPHKGACFHLQTDLIAAIAKLAMGEHRSKSATVTLLLLEALEARARAAAVPVADSINTKAAEPAPV
jgi:hypothetical protein